MVLGVGAPIEQGSFNNSRVASEAKSETMNNADLKVFALELAKSALTKRKIQDATVKYQNQAQEIKNDPGLTDTEKSAKLAKLDQWLQTKITEIKRNEGAGIMAWDLWREQRKIYTTLRNGNLAEIAGGDEHITATYRLIQVAEQKYNQTDHEEVIGLRSKAFNESRTFADMIITDNVWNRAVATKLGASAARSFARVFATGASLGAVGGVIGWFVGAVAGGVGGAVNKYFQLLHEVAVEERNVALGLQEESELNTSRTSISLSSLLEKLKNGDLTGFVTDVNTINSALEKGDLALRLDSLDRLSELGVDTTGLDSGRANVLLYRAIVQLLNAKRLEVLGNLNVEERTEVASAQINGFVGKRLEAAEARRRAILKKNWKKIVIAGGVGFGAGAATGWVMDAFGREFINEHLASKITRGATRAAEIGREWFRNSGIAEYWASLKEQAATIANNIVQSYNQKFATFFESTQLSQNDNSSSILGSQSYPISNNTDLAQLQNYTNGGGGGKPFLRPYIPKSANFDFDTRTQPDDINLTPLFEPQNPELQSQPWSPNLEWKEGRLVLAHNLGLLVQQDPDLLDKLLNKGDPAENVAFLAEAIQRESLEARQDQTAKVVAFFKKDPEDFIELQRRWGGDRIGEGSRLQMLEAFNQAREESVASVIAEESSANSSQEIVQPKEGNVPIADVLRDGYQYKPPLNEGNVPVNSGWPSSLSDRLREGYEPYTNQQMPVQELNLGNPFVGEFDRKNLEQLEQLYHRRFWLERLFDPNNNPQVTFYREMNGSLEEIFNFPVTIEYLVKKNDQGIFDWPELYSRQSYNQVALTSFNNEEYPVLGSIPNTATTVGPNVFISGHYFSNPSEYQYPFNNLHNVIKGDIVVLVSDGEEYKFEIVQTETFKVDENLPAITPFNRKGDISIIFITCTDTDGTGRVWVEAVPTEETLEKLGQELSIHEEQTLAPSSLEQNPSQSLYELNTPSDIDKILEQLPNIDDLVGLESGNHDQFLLDTLESVRKLYLTKDPFEISEDIVTGLSNGTIDPIEIIKLHKIIDTAINRANADPFFETELANSINDNPVFSNYLNSIYPSLDKSNILNLNNYESVRELIALKTLVPKVLEASKVSNIEDFNQIVWSGNVEDLHQSEKFNFPPLPQPREIPNTGYVFYSLDELDRFMQEFITLTQDPDYTIKSYNKIMDFSMDIEPDLAKKYIQNLRQIVDFVGYSYFVGNREWEILNNYVDTLENGLNWRLLIQEVWFTIITIIRQIFAFKTA